MIKVPITIGISTLRNGHVFPTISRYLFDSLHVAQMRDTNILDQLQASLRIAYGSGAILAIEEADEMQEKGPLNMGLQKTHVIAAG